MDNLLGVLIGAGITAVVGLIGLYINRKTEHSQWLRNQKLEIYSEFLDAYADLYKQIQLARQDGLSTRDLDPFIVRASPTKLTLVAPKDLADMATKIHETLMWLALTIDLAPKPPNVVDSERRYGERSKAFEEAAIADMKHGSSSRTAVGMWARVRKALPTLPSKRQKLPLAKSGEQG